MANRQENALQTAVRWAGTGLFFGSLLAMGYGLLTGVMRLFVPADKRARKRLAQKLGCDMSVLPEAFACYTILCGILALVWVAIAVSAYAILFTREDGTVPGLVGR